jgi:hypothetical protein
MSDVTGEQVRDAMIAADISVAPTRECSLCGYPMSYSREGERLFYDPGCDCSWRGREPREWQSAADWINMQTNPTIRDGIRARFGLPPESHDASEASPAK